MKDLLMIVHYDKDWEYILPSELGRISASKNRAMAHAKKHGYTTLARCRGNSGLFYAPLLVPQQVIADRILAPGPNL